MKKRWRCWLNFRLLQKKQVIKLQELTLDSRSSLFYKLPMLQFKIPQDVQRPDKIVAFLTLKQLIICMAGGGMAYAIYVTLSKTYFIEVWLPPVALVSLLTIATAFLKINDIPFVKFVLLTIEFIIIPRKRRWVQGAGDPFQPAFQITTKKPKHEKKSEKKQEKIKPTIDQIDKITKILDTHGNG